MDCLISLGANLGDRRRAIEAAAARLADDPAVERLRLSRLHESRPVGGPPGQPPFINAAARLDASLAPDELLARLHRIEAEAGRVRAQRWAARPIDLDLLLYGRRTVHTAELQVPHPRMAWRRFVLEPAAEVAAEMVHPTTGWTIDRLREHLDATPYFLAVTGSIGAGKTSLAEQLAARRGGRLIREPLDPERLAGFYADPASRAWATELEFLACRERLLARAEFSCPGPRRGKSAGQAPPLNHEAPPLNELTVSDFWFGQSAAFARVWLDRRQYALYRERFDATRRRVARPRLIVLLRATAEELHHRVRRRARRGEQDLPADTLARIAEQIERETERPDVGPVLRLDNAANATHVLDEVVAAADAMR